MVQIRLTTRSKQYLIPTSKYMVPSDWKRFQLSQLINKVLENSQIVPFDFVINDNLLRSSLKDFIKWNGLSTESLIEIEYIESVLPPKFLNSFHHDDWISNIKISNRGIFLTACYDSGLRLFSSTRSTEPILTITGHDQPILSASWISNFNGTDHLASGGMDRVIRIWKLPSQGFEDQPFDQQIQPTTTHILPLHKSPVSTIETCQGHSSSNRLLTGDWQGILALWDLSNSEGDQEVDLRSAELDNSDLQRSITSKKRRKNVSNIESSPRHSVISKTPIQIVEGHRSKLSRALFSLADPTKAFTASHDHTIKRFDLETGAEDWSKDSGPERCLMDMDECRGRPGLLVTGSMDRSICFFDVREESQNISLILNGHQAPVSSISSNPSSSNSLQILSGSFDGTCKIWDTRSTKQSLYTIRPIDNPSSSKSMTSKVKVDSSKVLSVAWNEDGNLIGFGGEEKRLHVHSVN
ncbi:WD40-repeat-containing domain protein [Phakopsora pachyrhizi]|nr:WD40-repeat-containing domain protein [Phakopsora pachyrhizi]